jgi:hypothetical protein
MNSQANKPQPSANPYLTAEHWRKVIAGSTRGLTAEQIALAAENAADKTRNGIQAAAWHEAAVVTGTLATCSCVPCVKGRSR